MRSSNSALPDDAYAFASDNTAPMTPEALQSLVEANALGCVASYGDDPVTQLAVTRVREAFECDCDVYPVYGGTAANALALSSVCQPYHAVFCHEEAHVEKDEAAAPEFFGRGMKLHPLPGLDGKVDLSRAEVILAGNRGVHSAQPRVLTLTQATELSRVYSLAELRTASEFCKRHGLLLHLDGARFANAVASLGCTPAEVSWKAGVDLMSLGGTKNGVGLSEAVVVFNRDLARDFGWRRKQAGQLASKMRFLTAPLAAALENGLWLKRAAHANAMAATLAAGVTGLGLRLAVPREANGVFFHMDPAVAARLEKAGWHFYKFLEPDVFRLMCAWNTTPASIDRLLAALAETLKG
jgi:threonine aldolase